MSKNRMFKITPPNVANRNLGNSQQSCNASGESHFCASRLFLCLLVVLVAGLIVLAGYKKGVNLSEPQPEDGNPVKISKALFYNPDSLSFYAAIAYKDDDPKGLFVTGMTYYLRENDPDFLPDYPAPNKEDAEIMLLHSADLGYPDAIQFIHCMEYHGCWNHSMPEDKVTLQ